MLWWICNYPLFFPLFFHTRLICHFTTWLPVIWSNTKLTEKMAITKTLSLGFSLMFRPPAKHLLHPSALSRAPKLSLSHQTFYFRCLAPPYKTPTNPFVICHGKVKVSLIILISSSFINYYTINIFILPSWIVTCLRRLMESSLMIIMTWWSRKRRSVMGMRQRAVLIY